VKTFFRAFSIGLGVVLAIAAGLAWGLVVLGPDVGALRWDRPWWLLLLAAVPLVAWLTTVAEDRRVPRLRFGSIAPTKAAPVGVRVRLRDVPGSLRAAALALVAIALAKPQSLTAAEVDERSGIDIMLVLDLSGSMKAADLKPTRVAAAKTVIQEFLERRQDDRIGAVVFAREAFLLSPLTLDKQRLAQQIGKMDLGRISSDGTAIGEGLGTALARLKGSQAESRVVILLTDGDNNAGEMSPEYATALAKKLGVKIYTVQMGNGDEVDVEIDHDPYGRPIYGRGRFPVKPEVLKQIATETGGEFFIATQTEELRSSMHQILDKLPKTRFEAASSDVVERFPLALIPAGILVIVEALVRAIVLRRFP
jgi:Ca-activated chloride channel family protein